MGKESHYDNPKPQIFLRAITGAYNLRDELKRLLSVSRVRRAKDLK